MGCDLGVQVTGGAYAFSQPAQASLSREADVIPGINNTRNLQAYNILDPGNSHMSIDWKIC
jgi:hypothetical protein